VKNKGFTLIELMIVVAIIGILANIAIPAYSGYIRQAKLTEVHTLMQQLKPNINNFYIKNGRFPKDNTEAMLPSPKYLIGHYVRSIVIENGAMHAKLSAKLGPSYTGKIVSERPLVVIGSPESPISWTFACDEIPEGMKAVGVNRTSKGVLDCK
jgi:type IV pilus assembly protein PilA